MGLTLITGPANAGKVALLLRRYLDELEREPVHIVPIRSDVERVERELLALRPALLGGTVGTFDDLFERIARGVADARPVVSEAQRTLIVRRTVTALRARMNGLGHSARFGGFVDALLQSVAELEAGLVDPRDLDGDVADLYAAYRAELDRLGRWDRDLLRRRAAERVAADFAAWDGSPVFAYGFEDLTGAEWALLQELTGRTDVAVSIPYEPGHGALAPLRRTVEDLGRLSEGRIEQLPPRWDELAAPAIAHLERNLFADGAAPAPPIDGALRFLEGAGARGALELVAAEVLELVRAGVAPDAIGIVCPTIERWRVPLETALATFGIPYSVEARVRLDRTPFGHALLALLRFAWDDGGRRDLFAHLRSPFSGLARGSADFLEGRLRGRAVESRERVEEETIRLRDGRPLPLLEALRSAHDLLEGVQTVAAAMLRNAYGLEAPPVGEASRGDLRAHDAVMRLLAELRGWVAFGGSLAPDEIVAALEHAEVRGASAPEAGHVAVLDLMRARTRRFEVLFLLGLEEGSLPRRGHESPFLGDELRRRLDNRRGARLAPRDHVARDRYLFYTACTRATRRVYFVREAATDDGSPREASP
ncbi:MAG TPA: hypothetical protein VE269_03385, partial [Gaiellaceae bacterium]|nr:hypothetical protein [Gaiellaceae bacterium]